MRADKMINLMHYYSWGKEEVRPELKPEIYILEILNENNCSGNFSCFSIYNFERFCKKVLESTPECSDDDYEIISFQDMWVLIQKEIGKIKAEKIMRSYDWEKPYTNDAVRLQCKRNNTNVRKIKKRHKKHFSKLEESCSL